MSCSLAVLSICFTAERGMLPTSDADVAVQFCAAAQSLLFYWKRKHKRTYELVWICCSRYHCSVQPGSTDRSVATGHSAWLVAGAASRIGALSLLAVLGCVGCVHHDDGLHAVAVHPTAHTADHAGAPSSPEERHRAGAGGTGVQQAAQSLEDCAALPGRCTPGSSGSTKSAWRQA